MTDDTLEAPLGEAMPIIGLHGPRGSGKDTIGEILVEDYGFHRVAFADFGKELLLEINPYVALPSQFAGRKRYYPMDEALARYGERWLKDNSYNYADLLISFMENVVRGRMGLEDYWIDRVLHMVSRADEWVEAPEGIVITDVRKESEAQAIVDILGGKVVEIMRDGYEPKRMDLEGDVDQYLSMRIRNPGETIESLEAAVFQMLYALDVIDQ